MGTWPARDRPRSTAVSSSARAAKVHLCSSVEVAAHGGDRVAAGKHAELGLLIEEIVDAGIDVHVVAKVVTHADLVIPLLFHLEIAWIAVVGIAGQHLARDPVRLAEPVDAVGDPQWPTGPARVERRREL